MWEMKFGILTPSLPARRVVVGSTSWHMREAMRVQQGAYNRPPEADGLFFFCLSLLWRQAGLDSTLDQTVWVRMFGVSLVLPGEKAGMLSGRMRALGECVQQNREEGTTKWQHCIWCVKEKAGVKQAWPWSCLYEIQPDLLGEGQRRRQQMRS